MTPKEHLDSALATIRRVAVPDAVLEAIRHGATLTERARIRQEFLEELITRHQAKMPLWVFDDIVASLDRICPEEAS